MDAQGLQTRAEELMARFRQLREGVVGLQRTLEAITGTASSSDGFVTAMVGPRGQLINLELDPRIYQDPDSVALAATITDTIQRATADAMEQVSQTCQPYLPEDEVRAHLSQDIETVVRRTGVELIPGGAPE